MFTQFDDNLFNMSFRFDTQRVNLPMSDTDMDWYKRWCSNFVYFYQWAECRSKDQLLWEDPSIRGAAPETTCLMIVRRLILQLRWKISFSVRNKVLETSHADNIWIVVCLFVSSSLWVFGCLLVCSAESYNLLITHSIMQLALTKKQGDLAYSFGIVWCFRSILGFRPGRLKITNWLFT